ncbi:Glutamate racemase [hydrothermal vent metagenome]|uniref:glutamate racemase n=1 Tax=hydrothermal vent metagenome TaxID=652676 RepID=A0A1W1ECH7_9ZZZZ
MKIGIFDSGLGGLTVVKALTEVVKGAEIFYVADTKNAPYGEKSPQQILQLSLAVTEFLVKTHNIDAVVVACNTATSAAISEIRKQYPNLMVIGTEPGIKPAFEQTETGKVGVLATPATLKGEKYQQLASRLVSQKEVTLFEQSCPGLVDQIEKGEIYTLKTRDMLEIWLKPMRESDVDTIVLGCTHYPLVSEVIEDVMQRKMNLIHTGDAIAKRLLSLSEEKGHENRGKLSGILYTTDKISKDIVRNIFERDMEIREIDI